VAETGPRLVLRLQGRASLVLEAFFPAFEMKFEADFPRVEVHGVFTSRSPLKKSVAPTLEKSDLKSLSDFRKEISLTAHPSL
jgi:hypothetical protein